MVATDEIFTDLRRSSLGIREHHQQRRCIREIREALKQKPKPSWNAAVPPILKKYHEQVKPMGVTLVKFNSEIGRLNGRYGVES